MNRVILATKRLLIAVRFMNMRLHCDIICFCLKDYYNLPRYLLSDFINATNYDDDDVDEDDDDDEDDGDDAEDYHDYHVAFFFSLHVLFVPCSCSCSCLCILVFFHVRTPIYLTLFHSISDAATTDRSTFVPVLNNKVYAQTNKHLVTSLNVSKVSIWVNKLCRESLSVINTRTVWL